MTDDQKKLFDALTNLQRRVATNVLSGMSGLEAYKAGGGTAKNDNAAMAIASRMLSDAKVKAFIDAMQTDAVSNAVMTRQEALERLSALARTSMADLVGFGSYERATDKDGNPVMQTAWHIKDSAMQDPIAMASIAEVTASKDGLKIKQHSPLIALKQLADMQGWNAPIKSDVSLTSKAKEMTDDELLAIAAGGGARIIDKA